jgi:S1-C subfamily serine protease
VGDLIVQAGGRSVSAMDDLFEALAAADGSLQLVIWRGTEERAVDVQFST